MIVAEGWNLKQRYKNLKVSIEKEIQILVNKDIFKVQMFYTQWYNNQKHFSSKIESRRTNNEAKENYFF